ncbi:SRPBCC family protein [Herbiconiux ginsengi]|uniref:SRPBCC family protein n=1 Tax=Herbiconiux ginsengi TaxID=381665 RepID=UPI000B85BCA8|nr:SRPBCC family protein [Herbiconiux ginsengi]
MGAHGIYVEIEIAASPDRVWELSQSPEAHTRWDLRFSCITPLETRVEGEPYRFRYERRVPFHTIVGTGIALGERESRTSERTSALRFTTDDRLSPLRDGRGYWCYTPTARGTRHAVRHRL